MESNSQELITKEFNRVRDLVLQKNEEYGDSVINPVRIFSTADKMEQIKVRIDDKLSRENNRGPKSIEENTVEDLIGYLIFLLIAEKLKKN